MKSTDEILKQFKQKNLKLFELNPTIKIVELLSTETIVYNPPKIQIEVWHPFIFDVRLIPNEFEGFEVIDKLSGGYPDTFPSEYNSLYFEDWYSPEWYVKFVDENLELISKKIKIANLTREEALDALTGNFQKHIDSCIKMRTKRIDDEKENIVFFKKLLYETKQAYLLSDVYNNFRDKEWYYSVTATKLSKNKPLIVGFNWGAEQGFKYSPQCEYPFTVFEGLYEELGSLNRTIPFFHEYYTKALTGMQTNFCFFRSHEEGQISQKDLELCKPLFDKYLDYVNPSIIISFSSKLRNYFNDNNLIMHKKTLPIKYLKGQTEIIKGKYKTKSGKFIDFVYIPHPNSRVSNEDRIKAWEFCFKDNDINAL